MAGLCPALIGRKTSVSAQFKVQLALCRASGRGPVVTPTKYLSGAYLVINRCGSNLVVQPSIWLIPIDMLYMSLVIDYLSDRLPS